jgi:hypothetical protein
MTTLSCGATFTVNILYKWIMITEHQDLLDQLTP